MPAGIDEIYRSLKFDRDDVDFSQWPKLSCSEAKQLALDSNLKLDTSREILFQGNGQLRASGDILFMTGETTPEKLRILANGNVGIGTSSPAYTLDVNGIVNTTAIYKNAAPWTLTTSEIADNAITATKIQDGSVGQAELAIGAVTELKIANSAVTEPKLATNAITATKIADGAVNGLKIAIGAVGTDKLADGAVTLTKLEASVRPVWSKDSSSNISYNSGNVGIGTGTTAPVAPLHIAGGNWNLNDTEGDLRIGDGTYKFKIGIARGGAGAGDVRIRAQGGTNRLILSSNQSDVLTIQNGSVGIGTITPSDTLDVAGNIAYRGRLTKLDVSEQFSATVRAADFLLGHSGRRGSPGRALVDAGGALGINWDGDWPSTEIRSNLVVRGQLYVDNIPFGDRRNMQWDSSSKLFYHDNSSRKSKENITTLTDDFSKVMRVEPKTYTRPNNPDHWEIGYIAEEFHELGLEKLVYYDDDGSPGAINYPKLSMYLLEIIKKHEQTIKDYEQRINQLEQRAE